MDLPMQYPPKFKDVGGMECPKNYYAYDQTTRDCSVCGQAKLYQRCHQYEDRAACAGWVHPMFGPLSCEAYVELDMMIDQKPKTAECSECKKTIAEDFMIIKTNGLVCYDCDDPDWAKDIPSFEERGAV